MPRAIIANTGMGATVAMVAAPTVIHCAGVGLIGGADWRGCRLVSIAVGFSSRNPGKRPPS
jgi:hypothetical protein